MITRAALGLAALLVSAPLGVAFAADWDGSAQAAHWHARAHHGHHHHAGLHHRHHHDHGWTAQAQRRVLYRNPAYSARWARPYPVARRGWYGHHGYGYQGYGYATGFAARPVSYHKAYPVAGSYVGGGLMGALYNQPSCSCR
jgi:hypothetical protein